MKNILLFGIGGVGKCVLWLLDSFIKVDPKRVTMADQLDYSNHPDVKYYLDRGSKYIVTDLNKSASILIGRLKAYDIVIDCTDNTDSVAIFEMTRKVNCHYINTSIEEPDNYDSLVKAGKEEFATTYQFGHNEINQIGLKYPNSDATAVLECGANPGMISHFAKHALMQMAKRSNRKSPYLKACIKERRYNSLAKELGVEVIHVSETDSTVFLDKGRREFCNTWCVNGLLSEYNWPAEFGWGSHEKALPKGAELVHDCVIDTNIKSRDLYVETYVPGEKFIGCVISHGEGLSLASYLKDSEYCPTVHYAYRFSPIVWRSIKKLGDKDSVPRENSHVVNNYEDKIEGTDTLGALLLTRGKKAFWCGSILSNDRDETGDYQGTLVQVAAPLLSCLSWMLKNPKRGWMFPEEVDTDYMIKSASPYLGEIVCDYVDYRPKSTQFVKLRRTKREFDAQFKKDKTAI